MASVRDERLPCRSGLTGLCPGPTATGFSARRMKEKHRTIIATYVAAHKHLRGDLSGAKTLTQMAREIGTTKNTVRRWLRRDHWSLWTQHWASVEEIWEAAQRDRQRLPQRERQARRLAEEQCRTALVTHLNRCLEELTSGGQLQQYSPFLPVWRRNWQRQPLTP